MSLVGGSFERYGKRGPAIMDESCLYRTGVEGDKTGAMLTMFTTSLAPELSDVEDVGEKGQTPVILESFRFVKAALVAGCANVT